MNFFRRKPPTDEWPFEDPPNVAVFTTRQVINKAQPILYVSHDEEDGGWQFHMGKEVSEQDARVVSLKSIVNLDPSVTQLANLPYGWIAIRGNLAEPWQRQQA